MGTLISLFGDWFNTLALYRLSLELTGSELALGGVLLTKLLPLALAAPVAAALVDRLDRKHVMIGADILRAVIVLGFLLIREPGDLWLLYTLAFAQIAVSAAFGPAKSAALPNVTKPGELLTANALLSASWSVMLALGAAIGGPAVDLFGTDAVFVFDALTYLVSAGFIAGMTIPQDRAEPSEGSVLAQAWRQSAEGIRYLRDHPPSASCSPKRPGRSAAVASCSASRSSATNSSPARVRRASACSSPRGGSGRASAPFSRGHSSAIPVRGFPCWGPAS